jgi:hypothetical protein
MSPLEKSIVDTFEKVNAGLSAVEDQTLSISSRLDAIERSQRAHGALLTDIMGAIGSLSDLVKEKYQVLSEGLSSIGARVRTSEQLMKQQGKRGLVRAIEIKPRGRNESDDR